MKFRALLACATLGAASFSQADVVQLDARAMLANPGFTVVDLKEESGREIGQLDRATVQRLVDVSGKLASAFRLQNPQVVISLVTNAGASADMRTGSLRVTINMGMLQFVGGNDNGVAAVLAHVMAHVQAAHRSADFTPPQEAEADALAARAMRDAGYNPHAEIAFWRVMDAHPKAWWNDTHHPYLQRETELAAAIAALGPQSPPNPSAVAPGDAKAFGQAAMKYATGEGGATKDYEQARNYAERAAAAGDPLGEAVLGALMRDGLGGVTNVERGVAYLEKAAQAGNAWAHYQLGLTYERGLGVPSDRGKALAHYKAAAAQMPEAAQRAAAMSK